jgi:hypothetical protein
LTWEQLLTRRIMLCSKLRRVAVMQVLHRPAALEAWYQQHGL